MSSDSVREQPPRQGGGLFFDPPDTTATPQPARTRLPERVSAVTGLDRASLERATRDDLERVLRDLLSALKNQDTALLESGEHQADGGLAIASQVAVWLLDHISNAFGKRLVNLAKVADRESLRSTRALATLLHTAIHTQLNGSAP